MAKPPTLEEALAGIRKKHGEGSIIRLGDGEGLPVPEVISSGSIALDEALIVGGFALGRVYEIYGPESSGKTSLALHAIANAQKKGRVAAFIDAEHALDPEWAATLGVDTDALFVSQPDYGEQALEILDLLAESGKVGIVVVDSVAALVPKAEIDGEVSDNHVALQARMMSHALRMVTSKLSNSETCCIFINQLREKVGVFFGSPETQPGGKALKFYATVRLDIRRVSTIKDGELPVGSKVKVKVVKNKLGPPFRAAEFDFMFGEGISLAGELVDLGVERGVIRKSGAWYSHGEGQLGQGKEAARQFLKGHPELAARVEQAVREAAPARPAPRPREALVGDGPAPWEPQTSGEPEVSGSPGVLRS